MLLRGINVGGKSTLRMAELREILGRLGVEDIDTYIQSGNVVARAAEAKLGSLSEEIASSIETARGFRPRVLLIGSDRLLSAIDANPFGEASEAPKSVHLFFLAEAPRDPDLDALSEIATSTERFRLDGDVFYLLAPDGIGRSRLAAAVERKLGVAATARNWRTVSKLRDMVEDATRPRLP